MSKTPAQSRLGVTGAQIIVDLNLQGYCLVWVCCVAALPHFPLESCLERSESFLLDAASKVRDQRVDPLTPRAAIEGGEDIFRLAVAPSGLINQSTINSHAAERKRINLNNTQL